MINTDLESLVAAAEKDGDSACLKCRQDALTNLQTCLAAAGTDEEKKKACQTKAQEDTAACTAGPCKHMA